MRRDARTRRDALIVAARDCFREFGYQVPLEDIAVRAGVGRGTLYRNFPDRLALAIAVFDREIVLLAEEDGAASDGAPMDRLEDLALRGARAAALAYRLLGDIAREPDADERFAPVQARATAMWRAPVERAKAAGVLRADIGVEHIMLLSRMIGGVLPPDDSDAAVAATVLPLWRLMVDGLKPR